MSNNQQHNKPNNQQPRQQQQATTTDEATKAAAAAASAQASTTTSPSEEAPKNDDLTAKEVVLDKGADASTNPSERSESEVQGSPVEDKAAVTDPSPKAIELAVKDVPQQQQIGNQGQQAQAAVVNKGNTPKARVNLPSVPVVRQQPVEGLGAKNPLDTTPIADVVASANSVNLSNFYEKLKHLDRALSVKVQSTPEEAAALMQQVYNVLVNVVERPASDSDFANHWNLAMRMLTETPDGGFTGARLWRGKPFWSLGKEKFDHWEALWNLIDASVRHRGEYRNFVNQRRVMVGFSGGAQGRLGIFYRTFN